MYRHLSSLDAYRGVIGYYAMPPAAAQTTSMMGMNASSPLDGDDTQQSESVPTIPGRCPAGFMVRTVAFIIDFVFLIGVVLLAFTIIPGVNIESLVNLEAVDQTALWAEIVSLLIKMTCYTYVVSLLATTVDKWVKRLRVRATYRRQKTTAQANPRYWAFNLAATAWCGLADSCIQEAQAGITRYTMQYGGVQETRQ